MADEVVSREFTPEEWSDAVLHGAEQFRIFFPDDSEHHTSARNALSASVLTLVQLTYHMPESVAPNGVTWSVGGPGGDYLVSIQRPNAPLGFPGLYFRASSQMARARRVIDDLLEKGTLEERIAAILRDALKEGARG